MIDRNPCPSVFIGGFKLLPATFPSICTKFDHFVRSKWIQRNRSAWYQGHLVFQIARADQNHVRLSRGHAAFGTGRHFTDRTWVFAAMGSFHFDRMSESLKDDGAPKSGTRAAAYRTLAPLLPQHHRAILHTTIRRFSSAKIRATVNSLMKDPCGRRT